jgi:hypothetical protein
MWSRRWRYPIGWDHRRLEQSGEVNVAKGASGSAAREVERPSPRRSRGLLLLLVAFGTAAIIGGVAGGLIVRATWDPGSGSSSAVTPLSATAAACPAATVAERALPAGTDLS